MIYIIWNKLLIIIKIKSIDFSKRTAFMWWPTTNRFVVCSYRADWLFSLLHLYNEQLNRLDDGRMSETIIVIHDVNFSKWFWIRFPVNFWIDTISSCPKRFGSYSMPFSGHLLSFNAISNGLLLFRCSIWETIYCLSPSRTTIERANKRTNERAFFESQEFNQLDYRLELPFLWQPITLRAHTLKSHNLFPFHRLYTLAYFCFVLVWFFFCLSSDLSFSTHLNWFSEIY